MRPLHNRPIFWPHVVLARALKTVLDPSALFKRYAWNGSRSRLERKRIGFFLKAADKHARKDLGLQARRPSWPWLSSFLFLTHFMQGSRSCYQDIRLDDVPFLSSLVPPQLEHFRGPTYIHVCVCRPRQDKEEGPAYNANISLRGGLGKHPVSHHWSFM